MNSNGAGAGAMLWPKGALCLAAVLALAFVLSAATARAQDSDKARPPAAGASREASTSAQTRSRRVAAAEAAAKAASEAAAKKNEGGKMALTESAETAETASAPKAAANTDETEDVPPVSGEALRVDRLSSLRAQIKDAKDEAERARLRRTLIDYLVALDRKSEAIDELRMMLKDER
ncbi:MAG TPA: hypothetical protein VGC89_06850, partial [Pyrinomonadaceae bacterium]